jgi:hypothetical protein
LKQTITGRGAVDPHFTISTNEVQKFADWASISAIEIISWRMKCVSSLPVSFQRFLYNQEQIVDQEIITCSATPPKSQPTYDISTVNTHEVDVVSKSIPMSCQVGKKFNMSFGFGVGDIITVIQLTLAIYDNIHDAPRVVSDTKVDLQYLEDTVSQIQNDLQSLCSTGSKHFADLYVFSKKNSTSCRGLRTDPSTSEPSLQDILTPLKRDLSEMKVLLEKWPEPPTLCAPVTFGILYTRKMRRLRGNLSEHQIRFSLFIGRVTMATHVVSVLGPRNHLLEPASVPLAHATLPLEGSPAPKLDQQFDFGTFEIWMEYSGPDISDSLYESAYTYGRDMQPDVCQSHKKAMKTYNIIQNAGKTILQSSPTKLFALLKEVTSLVTEMKELATPWPSLESLAIETLALAVQLEDRLHKDTWPERFAERL